VIEDESATGGPCPEGIHQDGFELISVHLINRFGIEGDTSTIYDNKKNVLAEIKLINSLDTLYAYDGKVLHYTTPFNVSGCSVGIDTLLMSYEPKSLSWRDETIA
jgi:hypothetical protein